MIRSDDKNNTVEIILTESELEKIIEHRQLTIDYPSDIEDFFLIVTVKTKEEYIKKLDEVMSHKINEGEGYRIKIEKSPEIKIV